MGALFQFKVQQNRYFDWVKQRADLTSKTTYDALREEFKFLLGEIIQRTPPFSGKAIKKMLAAQGRTLHDTDIEDLSAMKVGQRRVEKDIRKVIYGVKGAAMVVRETPEVFKSQNSNKTYGLSAINDWGVYQRCEGKDAVRIFATKGGEVFGIDRAKFMPNATLSDLGKIHQEHRTRRGRVTTAGQGDVVVGRWRWLNIAVAKDAIVEAYIDLKKAMVGQAKGGWADGFMRLGGRMSAKGWIGKHRRAGVFRDTSTRDHVRMSQENNSAWASVGDTDRIIAMSEAGRMRALEADIRRKLQKIWGNKAGDFQTLKDAV